MNPLLLPHLFKEELYHFTTPVLVVLARPWTSYSSEEHAMLHRMLGAVKLSPSQVRVIVRPELDLASLKSFSPDRVLVFGSSLQQEIPRYQETPALGLRVINAEDLNALDDQKKKNLWAALRQMFAV